MALSSALHIERYSGDPGPPENISPRQIKPAHASGSPGTLTGGAALQLVDQRLDLAAVLET